MSPLQWALLPFSKFFVSEGRAPRAEYWWFTLFYVIARIAAYIADSAFGLGDPVGSIGVLTAIVIVGFIVPQIMVGIRRLHDTGKPGWWLLASIVPIVGLVVLVFLASRGDDGANDYGPDPYGENELEQVFA